MTGAVKRLLDELANIFLAQEPGAADLAMDAIKIEELKDTKTPWTN